MSDETAPGDDHPLPAYVPSTGWPAGAALAAALLIFAVAITISSLVTLAAMGRLESVAEAGGAAAQTRQGVLLLTSVLVMQAIVIALTLLAAGLWGSRRQDMLALHWPADGWRAFAMGFAGLIAVVTVINVVGKVFSPGDFERDLQPFIGMARSDAWWVCLLAVGVGAPLSEELMFRGFLFAPLAKGPLGVRGAALVTSAAWAALHASYSPIGIIEVGLIGLYLSYLLWRSGSLWVPMLCHGIYNSLLFAFIAVMPAAGGS